MVEFYFYLVSHTLFFPPLYLRYFTQNSSITLNLYEELPAPRFLIYNCIEWEQTAKGIVNREGKGEVPENAYNASI